MKKTLALLLSLAMVVTMVLSVKLKAPPSGILF